VAEWDDARIWAEFCSRVNGNGFEPKEGTVIEMWFDRSATSATPPCGTGNLVRTGDAAHAGHRTAHRCQRPEPSHPDRRSPLQELDNDYNPGLDRLPGILASAGGAIGVGWVCSMMVLH
jgi:p-hydroxybenzoate 3-monooxygenase